MAGELPSRFKDELEFLHNVKLEREHLSRLRVISSLQRARCQVEINMLERIIEIVAEAAYNALDQNERGDDSARRVPGARQPRSAKGP